MLNPGLQVFAIIRTSILSILIITSTLSALAQSSACPDDLLPRRYLKNGKMGYTDLFDNWVINPKYFETHPFQGRFAKVRYGNKYGMINCEGTEVIPPKFDELGFFNLGRLWAKDQNGWTLWDSSGNELNHTGFEEFNRTSLLHGFTWVLNDRKWQLINENDGEILCDRSFTTVKTLSDSLSMVSDDGYFGIINHKNCRFKVPEQIVSAAKVSSRFIKVQYKNRKFDILDNSGTSILNQPYDQILPAGNGLARVRSGAKWGLISASGKVLLPAEFDSISHFSHKRLAVKRNNVWTYLDEALEPAFDRQFRTASLYGQKGAIVETEKGWELIDQGGNNAFDMVFDSIRYAKKAYFGYQAGYWKKLPVTSSADSFEVLQFDDEFEAMRARANAAWGVYNFTKGIWSVTPQYEDIEALPSGFYIVEKSGKKGLIDSLGNAKLHPLYSELESEPGFRSMMFKAKKEQSYQLLNLSGKIICECPAELNRIGMYFTCKTEKSLQVLDVSGKVLIEDRFEALVELHNSFAFKKKDKWGLIDTKGTELLKADFTGFQKLNDSYIVFKSKIDGWSIFQSNGKWITEDRYFKSVTLLGADKFIASTADGIEWLNTNGKLLKNALEYEIPDSQHIALNISGKWLIYENTGVLKDDRTFDAVKKESGLVLFQSGSKWFFINRKGSLSPWLPFD